MTFWKTVFGNTKKKEPHKQDENNVNSENNELSALDKFLSKTPNDRFKDIMLLGDSGNKDVFEILEYAIRNDNDSRVVMAALKRIHKFKGHKRLIPLLEELKNKENITMYEPYYSMALLNLGMITEDEFNNIFDK